MSNNVFVSRWEGEKTGWLYKLSMYGASTDDLTSPVEVELPPGMISVRNLNSSYDKYNLGAPTIPELDIDIYFEDLPDDLSTEFQSIIFDPYRELTVSSGVGGYAVIVRTGTVVKLEINFKGNDDTDVYRLIFKGVHKSDYEISYDVDSLIYKIKPIAISKIMTDCINFHYFIATSYDPPSWLKRDFVIELAYVKDGTNYAIGHNSHHEIGGTTYQSGFIFTSLEQIEDYILTQSDGVIKRITRNPSETFLFDFPTSLRYFKQQYLGNGARGDELMSTELFALGIYGNTWVDGAVLSSGGHSLDKLYPNSIWDYLSELSEETVTRIIYPTPTRMSFIEIYGFFSRENKVVLDKNKMSNLKLRLAADIVKTVTTSLRETLSDDSFADIDNVKQVQDGIRNDLEFSVALIYNNMPTCVTYENKTDEYATAYGMNDPWSRRTSFLPHVLNLYYFDKPAMLIAANPPQAFRVHEHVRILLGKNADGSQLWSDDLTGQTLLPWTPNEFEFGKPSEAIMTLQNGVNFDGDANSGCKPQIIAKTILALFSNVKQAKLEFEIDLDEYTEFLSAGAVGFPWWQFDTEFEFDVSTVNPFFNITFNKWYIVKSDINFETETAKMELILRTV